MQTADEELRARLREELDAWSAPPLGTLAADGVSAGRRLWRRRRMVRAVGGTAAALAVGVGVATASAVFGADSPALTAAGQVSAPPGSATTPAPPTTMGEIFQQWAHCPDSALTVVNLLPGDPPDLQQRWRDACRRDITTLSALLPGYEITPDVTDIAHSGNSPLDMGKFENPAYVVPAGDTPLMGPNLYRVVARNGDVTSVTIRASSRDNLAKPTSGKQVTLPGGLTATLAVRSGNREKNDTGCEIYVKNGNKTFVMLSPANPNFDFQAVATSAPFAQLIAQALAAPES